MSSTENIIVTIFIVCFFLLFGILIYENVTSNIVSNYEMEKQEFLYDMYSNNINAILIINENNSHKSIGDLLANSIYYRKDTINYSETQVNSTKIIKEYLDASFNEDKYYFEIKPNIIDVSLNFVIDGSNSLDDERKKLGDELPNLIKKIKNKIGTKNNPASVIAQIYILGDKDNLDDVQKCDYYDIGNKEINCQIIGAEELYKRETINYANLTYDKYSTEYYKEQYDIKTPYFDLEKVRETRKNGEKDYYEADWGNGVSYVSTISKDSAKLILIFPMGDELSTSSIAETCFDVTTTSAQKICDICTKSCDSNSASLTETENRSFESIKKASTIAKDNNHYVNPIFAYSCNYEYKPIFNTYFEIETGISTSNACQEDSCSACTYDNGECFHSECQDEILRQMEYLADETGGELINLNNIDSLITSVDDTINQNIDDFKIIIGEKQDVNVKYVLNRELPLPNKLTTTIRLEVYE